MNARRAPPLCRDRTRRRERRSCAVGRIRLLAASCAGLLLTANGVPAANAPDPAGIWDLGALSRVPRVFEAPPGLEAQGVRALMFEGEPYEGRPTRVFAYYGAPKRRPGERVPGVVLLHEGGGTADPAWVRLWNRRGYAAIAIDYKGGIPVAGRGTLGRGFTRNPHAPPWAERRHRMWEDMWRERPVRDCWMYHAVASAVLAHSLLASFDAVDPDRIGFAGVSWGAIVASNLVGVDARLSFAVLVYGCGFLFAGDNVYSDLYDALPPKRAARGKALWDGSAHLPRARLPILWINGTNDTHFPLDIWQRSYLAADRPRTLRSVVRLPHGRAHGRYQPEIYAFADHIVKQGPPLIRIVKQTREARVAKVSVDPAVGISKAGLVYSRGTEHWSERRFELRAATIDEAGTTARAEVPQHATAYYFDLTDARGLTVGSEHVALAAPAQ